MSYSGGWGQDADARTWEAREPGARRKKLAGYLKAANELRQSYAQNYRQTRSSGREAWDDSSQDGIPGSYPGASMTRNGEEQLVIFPSYARHHVKQMVSSLP